MPYLEADAGELSQAPGKLGLHSEFHTSLVSETLSHKTKAKPAEWALG